MDKTKHCCRCSQTRPLTAFSRSSKAKDGWRYQCKLCDKQYRQIHRIRESEYQTRYHQEHKDRINQRHKDRYREYYGSKQKQRLYGISPEHYQELLIEQNFACRICRTPVPYGSSLCVDHNHITGEIRGLLCGSCNQGLGRFKDDPKRLVAAVEYLKYTQKKET